MATCIIEVHVVKPGDRAEELLRELGERLGMKPDRNLSPDLASFWFTDATSREATNRVKAALDRSGTFWPDHLMLRYPPDY